MRPEPSRDQYRITKGVAFGRHHLRRLGCRDGSGRVREQAVQMLHREANVALSAEDCVRP